MGSLALDHLLLHLILEFPLLYLLHDSLGPELVPLVPPVLLFVTVFGAQLLDHMLFNLFGQLFLEAVVVYDLLDVVLRVVYTRALPESEVGVILKLLWD